jgi:hypothetical protein
MISSMTMIRALGALLLLMANTTPSGQPTPKQPSDYTPARPSKVVSWQLQRVLPPSPVYVGIADLLVVGAASSQTNEVVTVNYRLLRAADGVIVPGQFTVAPANTRAVKVQTQQLAEGFLLSVSVKAAVATTRGMTFVRAFLGAGPFGAGQPSYMLMADYVTTAMAPAHPNGRVLAPSEGPGNVTVVTGSAPAAGSDWSIALPTNARWRILSGLSTLQTSSTVANRAIEVLLHAGGNDIWAGLANQNVVASTFALVDFGAAVNSSVILTTKVSVPLPNDTRLIAPGSVHSTTGALQAADQWGQQFLLVEEWLDNV